MERRDFFRNSGRWLILAGMALTTGLLVVNRRVQHGPACKIAENCRNCGRWESCGEPQAKNQRENG
ncbi:MAG TPA: hypothetical protein PK167_07610 [Prolixibacteraceae bacterium]|nr:hypothetical protein [Prolixibacteraceae bacterium]